MPTREIYWNIALHNLLYLFTLGAVVLLVYGFYRKYRLWRLGRPENRLDRIGERIATVLLHGFGHARIASEPLPGIMHLFIFWGFLVLFVGTIVVALQADFGLNTLYGRFYLYFQSLFLDIMGLVAIIGVLIAAWRRYVQKPSRLDTTTDDGISLILLFLVLLTGFLLEGLRIIGTADPWAAWSPVGNAFAAALSALGLRGGTERLIHQPLWWAHLFLALGITAYLPYSKLFHIVLAPLNQFLRPLGPPGALAPVDLEDESAESFGAGKLRDLTWKQLFDAESCTRCGRCQDNCPAHLSEKPLSPKVLTQNLRRHLLKVGPALLAAGRDGSDSSLEVGESLIGNTAGEDELWSCTTCRACEEKCPLFIEHVELNVDMRRYLVLTESKFPHELNTVFRNMENNFNPWGIGWASRADWTEGLDVKSASDGGELDLLYWVGCAGSFDDRNKRVAAAVVKLLQAAGVRFAILGTKEKCCGDSARRAGNEYLFQTLAQENIETLNGYDIKKILTHCPHCFNTLANEYPQFGGNYQVVHHSTLLWELVSSGRITLTKAQRLRAVYHDSCYLGRYNGLYDEPRKLIASVPGLELGEMRRSRAASFCCGAGGGRMWMEETLGRRINEMRVEEALGLAPDVVGTACPFCLTMIEDGLKAKEVFDSVKAMDLAELLVQSISKGEST